MSLGVLNNLSAVYAENNLNNTSNSLNTVLQQLSSGSKINSGADDAAGLSLVDGLQANQTALTQSGTNATEGVGLLQVADGALSQVTSLLNRAVTLATEASNGTLNSSQDAAANQEYQSILSEINNIGSTTTYNQQKVFGGADVGIYTGDSSTQSASLDNLHFAAVTSSSVGDAGGTVQQSSGGIFVDLSSDSTAGTAGSGSVSGGGTKGTAGVLGTAAQAGDTIAGGITFTITNPDNTTSTVVTNATSVGDLVAEINKDGIPGVTASLTTAQAAGDVVGATNAAGTTYDFSGAAAGDTGILLSDTDGSKVAITYTDAESTPVALSDSVTTTTGSASFTSNNSITTIQYVAGSSETNANLTTNNLTTSGGAQATLTALNSAITDVAAQDGYIGAQINTLNAVSQVLSTQQENVQSAQNAVQATDYASATSNMSKYEILSQTGISALAQANSMQQEVTKLLQ